MAIPEKEIMDFIGELFKGFADPTRVHILYLLAEREQCVSDIAEQVDLSQSAISPPAADPEADAFDQIPPGRQKRPLFSG